ncbi:MAG TPA: hypothetical protein VES97_12170 [Solirubrobacteraceae bacterium]|nr:hypothetical protein [Solirubrobacteraceae bacterium]
MRPRLVSLAGLLLGLLLAGAMLGGCGGGSSGNGIASKTPAEIVAAAKSAADGAATVHVAGSITNEGKPLSIDMKLLRGRGGQGRITLQGLAIDLIRVDRIVYINGSAAFYRRVAGPTAAQLLQGKWLKVPASSGDFSSLASLTDLGKLLDTTLAAHGTLARGGTSTVDGQKVVAVNDVSKGGTLYVAATGSPYPVAVVRRGASPGRIAFDRWNKPVSLAAPASSININQLRRGH